mgnify:CR=1 FL=1|tara:strand:+ start:270 stop:524 length:255 start_codon:yes stop_codon:yes gene_type:complete
MGVTDLGNRDYDDIVTNQVKWNQFVAFVRKSLEWWKKSYGFDTDEDITEFANGITEYYDIPSDDDWREMMSDIRQIVEREMEND